MNNPWMVMMLILIAAPALALAQEGAPVPRPGAGYAEGGAAFKAHNNAPVQNPAVTRGLNPQPEPPGKPEGAETKGIILQNQGHAGSDKSINIHKDQPGGRPPVSRKRITTGIEARGLNPQPEPPGKTAVPAPKTH
jgi:hypothetical protein